MRESRSTSDLIARTSGHRLLLAGRGDLLLEQLDVEADGRERVPDLVGDVRRHLADGGEALGLHQLRAGALDGGDHALEGGGELADLVVGVDDLARREIAARDGVGARGHRRERRQHAARVDRGHQADEQREERQADEELHAALLAAARGGREALHRLLDARAHGAQALRALGLALDQVARARAPRRPDRPTSSAW